MRPVGIGVIVGVVGSLLVAHTLRRIWIGVPVLNSTYWFVGAGVLIWSFIAGILALRRLSRSSPGDLLKA
jgi:ABC-type antimicrobial peptide transport system permease subunit